MTEGEAEPHGSPAGTPQTARRRVLSLVFTALALLALGAGSALVGAWLLGFGAYSDYPGAAAEGADYIIWFGWPFVVLVVWLFGSAALLMARRPTGIPYLFALCAFIVSGVLGVLYLIVIPLANHNIPMRGLPAALVALLFLTLNAGAIYLAWRFMWQGKLDSLHKRRNGRCMMTYI